MTNVRLYLDGERAGPLFKRGTERQGDKIRTAVRGAASDAAVEIEARGDVSIEAGGNFGSRWTEAFHATVTEGGGSIRISAGFDGDDTVNVAWPVFEFGATIKAKNPSGLLWIPFSFAGDAKGVWPSAYPDPLFRVTRKSDGLEMLLSEDGPKYFGKPSVTVPRKWKLREIIRDVAREFHDYFNERFKK